MLTPFIKSNIKVVNKKTHEPTEYDYYIGRPSMLGNPYTHLDTSKLSKFKVDTRDEAIALYEDYFYERVNNYDIDFLNELDKMYKIYKEHGELNLVCWCKPKSCHGDHIKKYLENILFNI